MHENKYWKREDVCKMAENKAEVSKTNFTTRHPEISNKNEGRKAELSITESTLAIGAVGKFC